MTYRQIALDHATLYVGVHEQPAGSNRGPLIDQWLRAAGVPPGNPWCMAFVRAMFWEAGYKLGGGASVGNFQAWAKAKHYVWATVAKPGDVACYEWEHDNWPDHVGIVHHVATKNSRIVHWDGTIEPVRKGDVIAIEGNTAIGDDSDGGRVMFRARHPQLCKFARIPGSPAL
jgi:hypothetical protein